MVELAHCSKYHKVFVFRKNLRVFGHLKPHLSIRTLDIKTKLAQGLNEPLLYRCKREF